MQAPLPPIISKEYILNKVREEDLKDPQKVNKIFWTKLIRSYLPGADFFG